MLAVVKKEACKFEENFFNTQTWSPWSIKVVPLKAEKFNVPSYEDVVEQFHAVKFEQTATISEI